MIVMVVSGFFLGFIVAAAFRWRFTWFQWLANYGWRFSAIEVPICIAVFLGMRQVEKKIEKLARQRVSKLRGGQGEGLVGWYLNELPAEWFVFHNIKLWKNGDLDHVVVGPGGLFCISTKAHRGTYSIGPDKTYLLNGQETDDIDEAQRLALQLKDRLKEILGKITWIQPVLVAPLTYIDFHSYQSKAWVLHEENLNEVFLKELGKLNQVEIERHANAVKAIADAGAEL